MKSEVNNQTIIHPISPKILPHEDQLLTGSAKRPVNKCNIYLSAPHHTTSIGLWALDKESVQRPSPAHRRKPKA